MPSTARCVRDPPHLLLRSEENVLAACHSVAMTSETDGPPNQSWQPPSDYPLDPVAAQDRVPDGDPAQAPSPPPPAGGQYGAGQHGASQYGAGQYAHQASAYGPAGPDLMQNPFALAPRPGIIPLRPLGVTEIISGAFEALRANPRAMFLPALIVMSIVGLLSAVVTFLATRAQLDALSALPGNGTSTDSTETALETFQITGVASLAQLGPSLVLSLVSTILTGLLIMTVSRSVLGRIATPSEVWARVRSRIWPLIGQSVLIGLIGLVAALLSLGFFLAVIVAAISAFDGDPDVAAMMIGVLVLFILTIAFVLVAIYLSIRLSFSSAALILENVGVWEGMRRSWHLTKGSFWRVLGILLLALVITTTLVGLVSSALSFVGGLTALGGEDAYAAVMAGSSFLSSVLQAAVLPFNSAVVALTYIDLRMRKEGLDVELRQALLARGRPLRAGRRRPGHARRLPGP